MKQNSKKPKPIINKKVKKKPVSSSKKPVGAISDDFQKLVHLLQVNQIELEHQNEELRIAEEELETSRNKYVNLFDFSPIPYFVLNSDGIIVETNISAAKMFGMSRSSLIGRHFISYIPLEEKDVFHSFMKTIFTDSTKKSCKLRMMNKGKTVFHVLLEGLMTDEINDSDQKCQIALIDLTEYKKLDDSLKDVLDELKALKTVKK